MTNLLAFSYDFCECMPKSKKTSNGLMSGIIWDLQHGIVTAILGVGLEMSPLLWSKKDYLSNLVLTETSNFCAKNCDTLL